MSKIIPWWTPDLGRDAKRLVTGVVESGFPNDGEVTTRFEERLARYVGAKHAVAVTSGTMAIFCGLRSVGVGPGDEVLVPDITFIATANAVRLASATPVLVEVDPETFLLDVDAARRKITSKTRAIVPVHVSGRGTNLDAVLELAGHHDLRVVEDAAEALASRRSGRGLGTFGDVGCYSFAANKTLTTGQGGLVVTNDPGRATVLRQLKDQGRPRRGTGGDDDHPALGFNFKLTNLQSALGLAQLPDLARRRERLRRHYLVYRRALKDAPGLTLPPFDLRAGECPQWVDVRSTARPQLEAAIRSAGYETRRYWRPLHTQQPYQEDAPFPHADRVGREGLWLPSDPRLTDRDLERVAEAIQGSSNHRRKPVVGRRVLV